MGDRNFKISKIAKQKYKTLTTLDAVEILFFNKSSKFKNEIY